jgi:hypothetical protein
MAGQFPEHASGCPDDPDARRRNGCDGEAPQPVFSIPVRVGGETAAYDARRLAWELAESSPGLRLEDASIDFYRCPNAYLRPTTRVFLDAYEWARPGRGFLPMGPALADNPATFLDACAFLDAELAEHRRQSSTSSEVRF